MPPDPRFAANELHVSHSQVSQYLLCSERFRQKYVLGRKPSHQSGELVFGGAMHAALAAHHEHLRTTGTKPPIEATCEIFDQQLDAADKSPIPVLWADVGSQEELRQQGRDLLHLYMALPVGRILAVEQPFRMPATEGGATYQFQEQLVGVADVIEEEDGVTWITELKTSSRRPDTARLRYDLQLSLYAAARKAMGHPTAKLRFRFLLRQKQPAIETYEVIRDEAQVAEAGTVVSQVLRGIDHGIFFPSRGWQCTGCPYRSSCGE
jgi:CRISPR/Cas system-associated exonuclease Cas4 (RecB family)